MMDNAQLLVIQMNILIRNNSNADYVAMDARHVLVVMFVQHAMMDTY